MNFVVDATDQLICIRKWTSDREGYEYEMDGDMQIRLSTHFYYECVN